MSKPHPAYTRQLSKTLRTYWRSSLWHRIKIIVVLVVFVFVSFVFAIGQWYIQSEKSKPLVYGVSFIPDYAQSLGLNPEQTMDALLGIGIKHFRLVSYWSDMEQQMGTYDFSQLDWQFEKAEKAGAKVSLSVGMRQPRWPECHMPDWAKAQDVSQWQNRLQIFMAAVVNRYKDSPALQSYQVENEFFLKGFGICETIPHAFDRERLVAEYKLVKQLDPKHTIIINRSNNALGWPVGEPTPDVFGISVYKRVWDAQATHRYLEYPWPAWYYGFLAGWQKLLTGRDMVIHEMQAEAWAPDNKRLQDISLDEQNKSLNAKRLQDRFSYAKSTGMRTVDMWGGEYWYYRLKVLHDPSLWDVAAKEFQNP
jgi:hypothetical protein